MLAFSTCWNNSRHTDGEDIIDEILEIGFSNIELSHGMTLSKYPGIKRAHELKKFNCCGVHNYFPAPLEVLIDAPDAFEFSSNDSYRRNKSMRLAKQSLENAAKFGADYLVLHMGSVPMRHDKWSIPLTELAAENLKEEKKFTALRQKFIRKRAKYSKKYFSRAMEALEILGEMAKEAGVILAIESRSRYEDIPSEPEMRLLQEHFKEHPWIGYWHDFGHVQLKHNLDLLDHKEWLAEMGANLVGCHLHDVVYPAKDHRVPFTGELDYASLLEHVKPSMPVVWEISQSQKKEDIISALATWRHKFPQFS